jgi:cAMP-dependent protein kinase regulator
MDKQEYLEKKIKPIMDELVSQLAIERPEDPIRFIVNWIDKTGGYTTEGLNEQEKKEMEKLKEELKQLRSQS